MNFAQAKKVVLGLLIFSCAVCAFGLIAFADDQQKMTTTAIVGIVLVFSAVGVVFKWCRCPWCGKVIFKGLFKQTVCPECKRDLTTGKKKKGKGGNK